MKTLLSRGGYLGSCALLLDAPVNGVAGFDAEVVTMPTSEDLAAAAPLLVAFELRETALLGGSFYWSRSP